MIMKRIGRKPLNTNFGCTFEKIILIIIKEPNIKYPQKLSTRNKQIITVKQLNILYGDPNCELKNHEEYIVQSLYFLIYSLFTFP